MRPLEVREFVSSICGLATKQKKRIQNKTTIFLFPYRIKNESKKRKKKSSALLKINVTSIFIFLLQFVVDLLF